MDPYLAQIKKISSQQTIELPDIDNLTAHLSIQKETDIVLRESQERLNVAIEATGLGLWDYDVAKNVTYINSNYASMLGYTIDDFVRQPGLWASLIHPDDSRQHNDAWFEHLRGGSPTFNCTYRLRTKSGEWKWIQAQAKAKRTGVDAGSQHVIGTHKDITQHKQAEQQLELLYKVTAIGSEVGDFNAKLQKMLETLLAVISDHCGTIHLFNFGNQKLQLAASLGLSKSAKKMLANLPADAGLWRQVFTQNRPAMANNIDETNRLLGISLSQPSSYGVAFPINNQEVVLGVLMVFGNIPILPDGYEYRLIQEVANQINAACEREDLHLKAEHAAVMEERQRLARELHDSLSQSLYSLALTVDGALDYSKLGDLARVEQILDGMANSIHETLQQMRLLVYELRPSQLEREGLEGALHKRLDMIRQRTRMETSLSVELNSGLSALLEVELYGIAQEALNNVMKHSGATSVCVKVASVKDEVVLEVIDDGQGFQVESPRFYSGVGLASMRERSEKIGGCIKIISAPGKGTKVRVVCPANAGAPASDPA